MHSTLRCLSMIGLLAAFAGCATMTIEGDGQKSIPSTTGSHTAHGSFYNFTWSEAAVDKCANGQGLYRARYHTNMAYALVSVVSLGLYVPQTVEWWCDGAAANSAVEDGLYQPTYTEEPYTPGYSF